MGFIEFVLRGLGFAEEWTKLIMMYINSMSYSVLINGEQCGFFGASHGMVFDKVTPYHHICSCCARRGSLIFFAKLRCLEAFRVWLLVEVGQKFLIFSLQMTLYFFVRLPWQIV